MESKGCHALTYNIHTEKCGICSMLDTMHPGAQTSVNCTNFTLDDEVCTVSVKTDVCGHIQGEIGKNISVTLSGNLIIIMVCQHYEYIHHILHL